MLKAMAVVGVVGYIMEYSLVGSKLNYNDDNDSILMMMIMMMIDGDDVS
jgi:hypothetical protein